MQISMVSAQILAKLYTDHGYKNVLIIEFISIITSGNFFLL